MRMDDKMVKRATKAQLYKAYQELMDIHERTMKDLIRVEGRNKSLIEDRKEIRRGMLDVRVEKEYYYKEYVSLLVEVDFLTKELERYKKDSWIKRILRRKHGV